MVTDTRPAHAGQRVLFVGHEATRTGASLMLLHLLRWLREHSDIDFDLVLQRGGELVPDYRQVCTVFEMTSRSRPWLLRVVSNAWRSLSRLPLSRGPAALRSILAGRQIGLIYSNTVTNDRALAELALACPVVCHVHEVETYIQTMDAERIAAIAGGASMYIAVAEATRRSLLGHGVDPGKIVCVPGFAPIGRAKRADPLGRAAFRRRHGIPENAILVGGCGTLQWQKGPDLLVHVARILTQQARSVPLHFAWVGGKDRSTEFTHLRWDIARADLENRFSVIPSLADPIEYFDSLDILALVSRDDPLPLVAIEAGARGVPVVCFKGNAEIVDNECGVVVPYLDLDRYAAAVLELANDGMRRAMLGDRLAAKIRSRHDVSAGAPQIAAIIRSLIRSPSSP